MLVPNTQDLVIFRDEVLYDYFDMGATNSMAEWLRLGADPKGLLEADELEEFARLNNQVERDEVGVL